MISVIIPAYNAASTLKNCVESILASANENCDFEIIIVNDGSTDETDSICQILAKDSPQINYFSKANGGVSTARNFGLTQAKGEYICFVDADDMVSPEYLGEIALKASCADITFFGFEKHIVSTGDTIVMTPQIVESESDRTKIEGIIAWLLDNSIVNFFGFTWSKVFRSSIIKKYNLQFNPDLKIKEDEIFTLEYCRHIATIQVLEKPLYCYNIFETSLSHSKTRIRYDILFEAYSSLAKEYQSEALRKILLDISVAYGLGHIRELKRADCSRKEVLAIIDGSITPLLSQGYGCHAARWMPCVVNLVPASLKANAIYSLLR